MGDVSAALSTMPLLQNFLRLSQIRPSIHVIVTRPGDKHLNLERIPYLLAQTKVSNLRIKGATGVAGHLTKKNRLPASRHPKGSAAVTLPVPSFRHFTLYSHERRAFVRAIMVRPNAVIAARKLNKSSA